MVDPHDLSDIMPHILSYFSDQPQPQPVQSKCKKVKKRQQSRLTAEETYSISKVIDHLTTKIDNLHSQPTLKKVKECGTQTHFSHLSD